MSEIKIESQSAARRLLPLLLLIELFLLALDATVNYANITGFSQFQRLANIAREDGVATWFSSTQFLFIGILSSLLFMHQRSLRSNRVKAGLWFLTAVFFLFMALDDAAQIHERIGSAIQVSANRPANYWSFVKFALQMFPSYPWQLFVLPFYLLTGSVIFGFLWSEFDSRSRVLLCSGILFFALALGLDYVEGLKTSYEFLTTNFSVTKSTAAHFAKALEEFLEMAGASFVLVSKLLHFSKLSPSFRLHIV